MNSGSHRLPGTSSLNDLLRSLLPYEHPLVNNPRSLAYVPPPRNAVNFRLGEGVGDLDWYLFGPNTTWRLVRPGAISGHEWDIVSRVLQIVSYSTLSPYDFIIRIQHLFVENALPTLLSAHCASGSYPVQFSQTLGARLKRAMGADGVRASKIEDFLDRSGSQRHFQRDPAVLLNRMRVIRNKVVHADPSVSANGGVDLWGGIYLRYFEALLEELGLVEVGRA